MKQLPTKQQILDFLAENPTKTNKRDIGRSFGIKGAARIDLKRMLRELQADGLIAKRDKSYRDPNALPPVSVLRVDAPDADGDLFARPVDWSGDTPTPRVLMVLKSSDPALAEGHRVLARVAPEPGPDYTHTGRIIRLIGTNPARILGIFRASSEGGRILPIDKGSNKEFSVSAGATEGAKDGELVEAENIGPRARMGLPSAKIVARLGDPTQPRAISLIAIHEHGIPDRFPDAVMSEADAAKPATVKGREDLRDLPIITIDPSDARDRDDAVLAIRDDDPANPGGFHIWVAIADVSAYVTPGSELDREARARGNSTYFPDRVVPMLPDTLSGDLCSLHENVDRAVIAVRMTIDADGTKLRHHFVRGLIRSPAALSYEDAQSAIDGRPNDRTQALLDPVLRPLFDAYAALKRAREKRAPLEIDLPERQIVLSDEGKVTSVAFKDRLDAHKLIEECMVLANVAAAETLKARDTPQLYRVHEEPNPDKLDALREVAQGSGMVLAKGQVLHTRHLNNLLSQAAGTEHAETINLSTLRAMTQAYYTPKNLGHFGLALRDYAHFTSPIRRYSDLIVHRALITAHGWGDDGLSPWDIEHLDDTGKLISDTERRSMQAERDTTDRYLAAFLADRVGSTFDGSVAGIAKFGIFVKLDGTGADVLVPMRNLGDEYFVYDRDAQTLTGRDSGMLITMGTAATVKLSEVTPATGGMVAEIVSLDGSDVAPARGHSRKRGGPPRGKKKGKRQVKRRRG